MFEFDGILLKPCLLQPCLHVAGSRKLERLRRPAGAEEPAGGGPGVSLSLSLYIYIYIYVDR